MWRAIAPDGDMLNVLMERRLHTGPATRFLRKHIERCGRLPVIVAEKLGSSPRVLGAIAEGLDHQRPYRRNNRSKVSHRHTQRCEKVIMRLKCPGRAQRLMSALDQTCALVHRRRNLHSATSKQEPTPSTCGRPPPRNCEPDQPSCHMPVGAADNNLTTTR